MQPLPPGGTAQQLCFSLRSFPPAACVQTAKASGAMWDFTLAAGGIKRPIVQMLFIFDTRAAFGERNSRVPANGQKESESESFLSHQHLGGSEALEGAPFANTTSIVSLILLFWVSFFPTSQILGSNVVLGQTQLDRWVTSGIFI